MKRVLIAIVVVMMMGCTNSKEVEIEQLVKQIEEQTEVLRIISSTAYWDATLTGTQEDFDTYAMANKVYTSFFSNKEIYGKLKSFKEGGKIKDTLLKRQLDILYNAFLENQVDTEILNTIIEKEAALEQQYASFRATYRGGSINDNEVEEILRTSTDNRQLEEVWEAHKAIGREVADNIIEVVKLRNQVAQSLGFDNYHTMTLLLSEQDPNEITAIFDELDEMTRDGFSKLKSEMDEAFSKRYNVPAGQLMPWHFQGRYFQEAPNLYPVDLDKYYQNLYLEDLTSNFYKGIGLNVDDIMDNSNLYPVEGKNQHAFCTDIDGSGDIRVLCNITNNEQWMSTMLHEFGHGVYSKGHDLSGLPYFLREAAHTFTTEGVAMLFGRLSRNPSWMQQSLNLSDAERESIADDCEKSLRLQQLVFSRWVQVVYRFEKEMYANPDQDLDELWWNLVEKYQQLKRPEGRHEPDWAAKIHIALYPCYYHNYQLGELFASQMHYYIVNNITKSGDYKNDCYINNTEVGEWLYNNIFKVGKTYEWNDMIERATGEKLTAKYYKMQFVD